MSDTQIEKLKSPPFVTLATLGCAVALGVYAIFGARDLIYKSDKENFCTEIKEAYNRAAREVFALKSVQELDEKSHLSISISVVPKGYNIFQPTPCIIAP